MSLREDLFRRADGSEDTFAVVTRDDSVVVVCADGPRLLMTEQYRYAARRWSLELPQGGVGPGESTADAALRELREETGWEADTPRVVAGPLHEAADWATQAFHVVSVRPLRLDAPQREPGEEGMRVRWVSREELPALVAGGHIVDAATLAALLVVDLLPPSAARVAANQYT
ncbi:NUDIX hydrolase [Kitasatospora sp. NPDC089509]|uniref:NUDIX hydrolase n=1 Tax=Kitasatospora sp. NPDC089509 TaxID=3364079 RepID=UPI00382A323A